LCSKVYVILTAASNVLSCHLCIHSYSGMAAGAGAEASLGPGVGLPHMAGHVLRSP